MAIDEKDPIIKTLKTLRHCQSSTATERALPCAQTFEQFESIRCESESRRNLAFLKCLLCKKNARDAEVWNTLTTGEEHNFNLHGDRANLQHMYSCAAFGWLIALAQNLKTWRVWMCYGMVHDYFKGDIGSISSSRISLQLRSHRRRARCCFWFCWRNTPGFWIWSIPSWK